jgi:hypothetical protein
VGGLPAVCTLSYEMTDRKPLPFSEAPTAHHRVAGGEIPSMTRDASLDNQAREGPAYWDLQDA